MHEGSSATFIAACIEDVATHFQMVRSKPRTLAMINQEFEKLSQAELDDMASHFRMYVGKHPRPENHRKSTKMDKKHYLGRFHSKKTEFCKVGRIRAKTRHNKQHKAAFNFKRSSTTRDGKVGHARICRVATVVFVRWLVRCMSFLLTKPCMSQHKHVTTRLETVRLKQTKMLAVQCVHCLITYRES